MALEVFKLIRLHRTKANSFHSDISSCLLPISPGQLTCKHSTKVYIDGIWMIVNIQCVVYTYTVYYTLL